MNDVLIIVGLLAAPLLAAFLFALWDDNFSARHHRHVAEMDRVQADTAAIVERMRLDTERHRGSPCDECGLNWGYHQAWCRAWPGPVSPGCELQPWIPA